MPEPVTDDLDTMHPAPWEAKTVGSNTDHWFVVDANNEDVLGFIPEQLARRIVLWRNAEWVQKARPSDIESVCTRMKPQESTSSVNQALKAAAEAFGGE